MVHKITPLNMQHPNCQCEFEDFKESLTARCDVCFILDGRHCLGGCHKRHRIPVEGDLFHDAVNFISLSCIFHIYCKDVIFYICDSLFIRNIRLDRSAVSL